MVKRELIKQTARKTGFNQKDVEEIISQALEIIRLELKDGGSVNINQFGKFYITEYPGRNLTTPRGETITSKASVVPRFKAGKYFKDFCNNRLL